MYVSNVSHAKTMARSSFDLCISGFCRREGSGRVNHRLPVLQQRSAKAPSDLEGVPDSLQLAFSTPFCIDRRSHLLVMISC